MRKKLWYTEFLKNNDIESSAVAVGGERRRGGAKPPNNFRDFLSLYKQMV